ncbi:hypothetical protein AUJ10_01085, partial [Candidatus Pacearchaeota archaeon CG1_02_31_27]
TIYLNNFDVKFNNKMISKKIVKFNIVWRLISSLSKIPFMAQLIQNSYYYFFSYPKTMQLHINSECNYNCLYCYVNDKKVKPLNTEKLLDLITQAKKLGVYNIDFLGGEPFLHKDFYKLLQYTSKQNIGITIFTNGILINDNWIKKIKQLNTQKLLVIKYDYNKEIYGQLTGKEQNFTMVKRIIKKCLSAKIPVITFTVITKFNVNYVNKMIDNFLKLGAFPMFERYLPVKDEQINKKLEISKQEWEQALISITNFYSGIKEIVEGVGYLSGGMCSCFGNNLSIMQDGTVKPCPETPSFLSVGNVNNNSLKKIWKNFEKKRKEWLIIPKECKQCKNKYLCRGGCKAHTFIKYQNLKNKDPLCNTDIPTTYPHCIFPLIRLLKKQNQTIIKK